jgi:hypothetical protein
MFTRQAPGNSQMASNRTGLGASVTTPRLVLGPEAPRERTRHPSLESLIWKELRAFREGAPAYADLRAGWLAEYDSNESHALEALAQAISTRVGVCSAVVRPLIVQLVIRF